MHYLSSCVSDICLFKCNSESPSSVNDMDMVVFSARRHVSLPYMKSKDDNDLKESDTF